MLLVNPVAGRGRTASLAPMVSARLARGGRIDVAVAVAADPVGSRRAAHAAVREGVAAVVALGGDGIVHDAVQALAGTDVALGIVPTGTGNDLAMVLGLPGDPGAATDAVLDALLSRSVRTVDLARVQTHTGEVCYVATVVGIGFDAAVAARAAALRWPGGPHRYDVALALETLRLRAIPLRLTLDGRCVAGVPATLVAVGNADRYGGGKRIAPHARLDDGRLAVTVIGPVGRFTLARLAPTLPRAGHVDHPRVLLRTVDVVEVDGDAAVMGDGEVLGRLPVRVTSSPAALRVLLPSWCQT